MKPLTLVAILLIVIVIATFAYDGVNYTTTEPSLGHGPSPVTKEVTRTIPPLPIVGSVALLVSSLIDELDAAPQESLPGHVCPWLLAPLPDMSPTRRAIAFIIRLHMIIELLRASG